MSQHYPDTKIRQKTWEGKKPPDQNLSLTQMQNFKMLANQIQQYDTPWPCKVILGMHTCLIFRINVIHCICEVKKGKLYDHINRCRKHMWQNPTSIKKWSFRKIRIEGNFVNLVKGYLWKIYS